jgi:hypothetical protein
MDTYMVSIDAIVSSTGCLNFLLTCHIVYIIVIKSHHKHIITIIIIATIVGTIS